MSRIREGSSLQGNLTPVQESYSFFPSTIVVACLTRGLAQKAKGVFFCFFLRFWLNDGRSVVHICS